MTDTKRLKCTGRHISQLTHSAGSDILSSSQKLSSGPTALGVVHVYSEGRGLNLGCSDILLYSVSLGKHLLNIGGRGKFWY
jgi:hypothetical protein